MKAHLMFRDRDLDLKQALPENAADLTQDLELETLFAAMAGDDKLIREVVPVALLCSLEAGVEEIGYRQAAMQDALANPDAVRSIYALAGEALERERKARYGFFRDSPDTVLGRSIEVLGIFVEMLRRLRQLAEASEAAFRSEAFRTMFAMFQSELGEDYLREIAWHLERLKFPDGVLVSARLGAGNKGVGYVLRQAPEDRRIWPLRLLPRNLGGYTLTIAPRDEAGGQALALLRNRGLSLAASAVGQSVEHILGFLHMLRAELAFYLGGVNLAERLDQLGMTTAMPEAAGLEARRFGGKGLYDPCLALSMGRAVVGSDIAGDGKALVMITGANQGGKSTFLRGVGLAQVMLQAGLFVAAERLEASVVRGVFTHYKREEDASMRSGKFDEELARMSALAEGLHPGALVLFNESFASTNEREGSEVARQIVSALLDGGLRVVFVTHLYPLAHAFAEFGREDALFLRAERKEDGTRTFHLVEGEPLETSFGEDLYAKIFGDER